MLTTIPMTLNAAHLKLWLSSAPQFQRAQKEITPWLIDYIMENIAIDSEVCSLLTEDFFDAENFTNLLMKCINVISAWHPDHINADTVRPYLELLLALAPFVPKEKNTTGYWQLITLLALYSDDLACLKKALHLNPTLPTQSYSATSKINKKFAVAAQSLMDAALSLQAKDCVIYLYRILNEQQQSTTVTNSSLLLSILIAARDVCAIQKLLTQQADFFINREQMGALFVLSRDVPSAAMVPLFLTRLCHHFYLWFSTHQCPDLPWTQSQDTVGHLEMLVQIIETADTEAPLKNARFLKETKTNLILEQNKRAPIDMTVDQTVLSAEEYAYHLAYNLYQLLSRTDETSEDERAALRIKIQRLLFQHQNLEPVARPLEATQDQPDFIALLCLAGEEVLVKLALGCCAQYAFPETAYTTSLLHRACEQGKFTLGLLILNRAKSHDALHQVVTKQFSPAYLLQVSGSKYSIQTKDLIAALAQLEAGAFQDITAFSAILFLQLIALIHSVMQTSSRQQKKILLAKKDWLHLLFQRKVPTDTLPVTLVNGEVVNIAAMFAVALTNRVDPVLFNTLLDSEYNGIIPDLLRAVCLDYLWMLPAGQPMISLWAKLNPTVLELSIKQLYPEKNIFILLTPVEMLVACLEVCCAQSNLPGAEFLVNILTQIFNRAGLVVEVSLRVTFLSAFEQYYQLSVADNLSFVPAIEEVYRSVLTNAQYRAANFSWQHTDGRVCNRLTKISVPQQQQKSYESVRKKAQTIAFQLLQRQLEGFSAKTFVQAQADFLAFSVINEADSHQKKLYQVFLSKLINSVKHSAVIISFETIEQNFLYACIHINEGALLDEKISLLQLCTLLSSPVLQDKEKIRQRIRALLTIMPAHSATALSFSLQKLCAIDELDLAKALLDTAQQPISLSQEQGINILRMTAGHAFCRQFLLYCVRTPSVSGIYHAAALKLIQEKKYEPTIILLLQPTIWKTMAADLASKVMQELKCVVSETLVGYSIHELISLIALTRLTVHCTRATASSIALEKVATSVLSKKGINYLTYLLQEPGQRMAILQALHLDRIDFSKHIEDKHILELFSLSILHMDCDLLKSVSEHIRKTASIFNVHESRMWREQHCPALEYLCGQDNLQAANCVRVLLLNHPLTQKASLDCYAAQLSQHPDLLMALYHELAFALLRSDQSKESQALSQIMQEMLTQLQAADPQKKTWEWLTVALEDNTEEHLTGIISFLLKGMEQGEWEQLPLTVLHHLQKCNKLLDLQKKEIGRCYQLLLRAQERNLYSLPPTAALPSANKKVAVAPSKAMEAVVLQTKPQLPAAPPAHQPAASAPPIIVAASTSQLSALPVAQVEDVVTESADAWQTVGARKILAGAQSEQNTKSKKDQRKRNAQAPAKQIPRSAPSPKTSPTKKAPSYATAADALSSTPMPSITLGGTAGRSYSALFAAPQTAKKAHEPIPEKISAVARPNIEPRPSVVPALLENSVTGASANASEKPSSPVIAKSKPRLYFDYTFNVPEHYCLYPVLLIPTLRYGLKIDFLLGEEAYLQPPPGVDLYISHSTITLDPTKKAWLYFDPSGNQWAITQEIGRKVNVIDILLICPFSNEIVFDYKHYITLDGGKKFLREGQKLIAFPNYATYSCAPNLCL